MIATESPAPLRRIRLNRRDGTNTYGLKKRFAQLCEEHSVTLIKLDSVEQNLWTAAKDSRRCELIDKSLHTPLTVGEEQELLDLQQLAEAHFDEIAPPPIAGALKLHEELMAIKESQND